MSTEQNGGAPPEAGSTTDDATSSTNARSPESILAEMNRKTQALAAENQALSQKMDLLVRSLQQPQPQVQQATDYTDDQLEEMSFKDPKGYARAVRAQATKSAENLIDQRLSTHQQTQSVLSQLAVEYPELSDASSDLMKRAGQIYNSLPASTKADPIAYKVAVRDAAAELGVLPKARRNTNQPRNDDGSFALSGSGQGSASNNAASRKKAESEVNPLSLAFAKEMGIDITNKDKVARIQKRAQRKNWGGWQGE
jgi:hypothetical protein